MLERIILAAIATLCIYLFLQLGTKQPQPTFLGGSLTKTTNFLYSLPVFSR
jgi:hypothetical protein